ncbi:hypothetical protein KKG63_03675, partial [Patescibacteria group bacterium]|nr:hypothetical protein [Patescibacteria group bacterium]
QPSLQFEQLCLPASGPQLPGTIGLHKLQEVQTQSGVQLGVGVGVGVGVDMEQIQSASVRQALFLHDPA